MGCRPNLTLCVLLYIKYAKDGYYIFFFFFANPVLTYLDSILKSRDITLPAKVHLAKAMVFPVVMYGCGSWTINKAECRRTDALNCGVGEDS